MEIDSLAVWPQLADWFRRMMPIVASGRREFYNVVEQAGAQRRAWQQAARQGAK
jgi:hypothetical protein